MKKTLWIAAFGLVVLLIDVAHLCKYSDWVEYPSPNGSYIATVYVEDCHATVPFYTVVNIRPRWIWFGNKRGEVFVVKNTPAVRVHWKGNDTVEIVCPDCRRVDFSVESPTLVKADKWWGLNISYEFSDQPLKK